MEEINDEPIEGTINQLVVKNQANLTFSASILRTKCSFKGGIM
jgi:hypothetical protein